MYNACRATVPFIKPFCDFFAAVVVYIRSCKVPGCCCSLKNVTVSTNHCSVSKLLKNSKRTKMLFIWCSRWTGKFCSIFAPGIFRKIQAGIFGRMESALGNKWSPKFGCQGTVRTFISVCLSIRTPLTLDCSQPLYFSMHAKEKASEASSRPTEVEASEASQMKNFFFSLPTPTLSCLPFFTLVQFSHDPILVFNERVVNSLPLRKVTSLRFSFIT